MYEELGRVREPVALSPGEALSSAAALLVRQGYEVTQRTETALTVVRRQREGMFGHSPPNLTVAVRTLPDGGLEIKLRGNDREGVQARQAELAMWAEGLPKVGAGRQDHEQEGAQGAANPGTAEALPQGESSEVGEGHRAGSVPVGSDPKVGRNPGATSRPEIPTGAETDPEEIHATPGSVGGWAAAASWDRRLPVAAGKEDEGPTPPPDRAHGAETTQDIDASGQRDAPPSTQGENAAGRTPAGRSDRNPRSTDAPPKGKAAPEPMDYEYKMIQIPPTISVQASQHKGNEAAQYMEAIANSHAEQGWEFYRVDTLSVSIPPGCLAALFGDKGSQSQYYVMTFRRRRT